jgi:hypothetical protein
METTDLQVCHDCIMYIANGDLPDDNPANWQPEQVDRAWQGYQLALGDSDKDDEFSWSPCEGCGSRLAGNRFHCVAIED